MSAAFLQALEDMQVPGDSPVLGLLLCSATDCSQYREQVVADGDRLLPVLAVYAGDQARAKAFHILLHDRVRQLQRHGAVDHGASQLAAALQLLDPFAPASAQVERGP